VTRPAITQPSRPLAPRAAQPELTIVIPVWGRYVSLLEDCVASVHAQHGVSFRILIIDNASDDPLPELHNVEVARTPNRLSVGAARNYGLERVTTPFVLFMDADDLLLDGALLMMRRMLANNPRAVAAVCRPQRWHPLTDRRWVEKRNPKPIVFFVARFPLVFALTNLRWNSFQIVEAIIRTDIATDAGGFGDADVGEDWELCAALTFRGSVVFARSVGRVYRITDGSLWHRHHNADTRRRCHARLQRRLRADACVPVAVRRVLLPILGRAARRADAALPSVPAS